MTEEAITNEEAAIPKIIQLVNSNSISDVKELLMSGKGNIDEVDENGMTPLHHACYKGQTDICQLLLDYGSDVTADTHTHNYSALHFAALSGNASVVKLLLAAGAKIYHTNSLKRTAAQMAGFVGNHHIAALINNFLPLENIAYYTVPQGLETEPKLPPEVAVPLHDLIMQTNLHPVFIAMSVEKKAELTVIGNVSKAAKVLSLMCEKEFKRSENVNEILCMKLHYMSYILKTLERELRKQLDNEVNDEAKKEDKLLFESLIKKWLIGRPSDGFEEFLESYIRDAIKTFPYSEMPLLMQLVRNIASKSCDSWALGILDGVINGQKGFDDNIACSTCGLERDDNKKCAKCKSAQYCNRTCQRLHWRAHKKFCEKLMRDYQKRKERENSNKEIMKDTVKNTIDRDEREGAEETTNAMTTDLHLSSDNDDIKS